MNTIFIDSKPVLWNCCLHQKNKLHVCTLFPTDVFFAFVLAVVRCFSSVKK